MSIKECINNPKFKNMLIWGIIICIPLGLGIANYCYNIVSEIGGAYKFLDLLFGAWAVIATSVFAGLVWNQTKSQKMSIDLQSKSVEIQNEQLQASIKSTSASLVRDFYEKTYADDEFNKNLTDLNNHPKNMRFDNDKQIDDFVDHYEGLAIYWIDGVATDFHISEWCGQDLLNMYNCPQIMKYIEKTITIRPYPKYNRLYELIIKNHDERTSKDWVDGN